MLAPAASAGTSGALTSMLRCTRQDDHVPPLVMLYNSPYTVLHQAAQHFIIQMGAKEEVVSTGRLKPCLTPQAVPAQLRPPHRPSGPFLTPPGSAKPGETGDMLPTQPLCSSGLDCLLPVQGNHAHEKNKIFLY